MNASRIHTFFIITVIPTNNYQVQYINYQQLFCSVLNTSDKISSLFELVGTILTVALKNVTKEHTDSEKGSLRLSDLVQNLFSVIYED